MRGSSPLARGLPHTALRTHVLVGIIPARAGFTWPSFGQKWARTDHPRSRGVYSSSRHDHQPGLGIIPARAGFTPRPRPPRGPGPDHPRSRGVYASPVPERHGRGGSSPLARGLLVLLGGLFAVARIIPARAGFTAHLYRPCRWDRGSSPLARGLHSRSPSSATPARIIPARAGFTDNPTDFQVYGKDHPRSRGVYSKAIWHHQIRQGSSPLARGLLAVYSDNMPDGGIIPARAGFTMYALISKPRTVDHPRSRGVYCSPRWRA